MGDKFEENKKIISCCSGRTVSLPSDISDFEHVTEAKLLGVHFTDHLPFDTYVNSRASVVNQRFCLMMKF